MRAPVGVLAVAFLLGCGTLAKANVAVYVFQDDPARPRYAGTEMAVAFAVWATVILSGVWFIRAKGLAKLLPVGLALLAVAGCSQFALVNSNIRFLEGNQPPNYVNGLRIVGKDQPITEPQAELKKQLIQPWVYGMAMAVVATVAGLVVRQRLLPGPVTDAPAAAPAPADEMVG